MSKLWVPSRRLHLLPPTKAELDAVPPFGALLEIGAWGPDHCIFHQERVPSRSPVKQLLQVLLSLFSYTGIAGVVDTGGISRTTGGSVFAGFKWQGLVNIAVEGIVVGTGSTIVDILDTKLVTQILHGTGAGQMVHQAQTWPTVVTVVDPNATFETTRNFNNNSGAAITVAETGVYAYYAYTGLGTQYYFCIFRDVPTSVLVPNGGGCYVTYTLKITE